MYDSEIKISLFSNEMDGEYGIRAFMSFNVDKEDGYSDIKIKICEDSLSAMKESFKHDVTDYINENAETILGTPEEFLEGEKSEEAYYQSKLEREMRGKDL